MLQQWIEMYEFISIYFVNIFVNLKKKKKENRGEWNYSLFPSFDNRISSNIL